MLRNQHVISTWTSGLISRRQDLNENLRSQERNHRLSCSDRILILSFPPGFTSPQVSLEGSATNMPEAVSSIDGLLPAIKLSRNTAEERVSLLLQ